MNTGPPLLTYTIAEPFEVALRMVQIALARQGLRSPAELDITARIRQEMGAGIAPCTVLYVDSPAALLEAVIFHRGAGLLIPQPVVVTGHQYRTTVLVRNSDLLTGEVPDGVRDPLRDLKRRMERAMEEIAVPDGAPVAVSC